MYLDAAVRSDARLKAFQDPVYGRLPAEHDPAYVPAETERARILALSTP
ncbi:MAG: hypothetical protein M0R80_12390 [Proteobacteria bacterium]|nr:hypothetical protein [Pseudomonadota bacterium]